MFDVVPDFVDSNHQYVLILIVNDTFNCSVGPWGDQWEFAFCWDGEIIKDLKKVSRFLRFGFGNSKLWKAGLRHPQYLCL